MAKILVFAKDNVHADVEIDRRGCYKKGYPVAVLKDEHIFGRSEKPPTFVVLSCPEVTVEQLLAYSHSWDRTVDYNVVSADPATGNYQLEIYGNNVSSSGGAKITRAMVENYLNHWGATVDSVADNTIAFSVNLWNTLQSAGFWDANILLANFLLNDYSNDTANVTISNLPEKAVLETSRRVVQRGGEVTSSDLTSVTFTITRQEVIAHFRTDIAEKARATYCRKQHYFSGALVDQALLEVDGVLEVTEAVLLAAIQNKLEE